MGNPNNRPFIVSDKELERMNSRKLTKEELDEIHRVANLIGNNKQKENDTMKNPNNKYKATLKIIKPHVVMVVGGNGVGKTKFCDLCKEYANAVYYDTSENAKQIVGGMSGRTEKTDAVRSALHHVIMAQDILGTRIADPLSYITAVRDTSARWYS